MRLHVRAPSDVRVGDVFEVSIDFEAEHGLRQLAFTVRYAKSRLALVGWSRGASGGQASFPAEVRAQEPSDGNIEIGFDLNRDAWAAAAGPVAVLQFEALKPGTSGMTLHDVTALDAGGAAQRDVAVLDVPSITIH